MVCLSSQNVRKSDLEESYNISILVLCQIPGLRNQVLILQPLATNTVAALVPFPSKRSDLRRLCQGSHPFQDIDGFSGQSDCFSALQNLTRSRQSSSPRDVPPIKYTQPSRTAAAHLISINFYRPAFKHTNQQAQCKSLWERWCLKINGNCSHTSKTQGMLEGHRLPKETSQRLDREGCRFRPESKTSPGTNILQEGPKGPSIWASYTLSSCGWVPTIVLVWNDAGSTWGIERSSEAHKHILALKILNHHRESAKLIQIHHVNVQHSSQHHEMPEHKMTMAFQKSSRPGNSDLGRESWSSLGRLQHWLRASYTSVTSSGTPEKWPKTGWCKIIQLAYWKSAGLQTTAGCLALGNLSLMLRFFRAHSAPWEIYRKSASNLAAYYLMTCFACKIYALRFIFSNK